MSLLSLSTVTADIERKTTAAVSGGGVSETFAVQYDDVRGTLQPASGDTQRRFDRMSMNITHTFYTDTPIELLAGDRLVIGSTKYVVEWFEDQAGRGRVFAAHVRRTD
ncbi:MAG: hypothetical protein E6Q97_07125 [Desulfurellales bacterium]|nr:MAG: hypothetical protein E6Q97_07125 [Desulfurellales bacterium]